MTRANVSRLDGVANDVRDIIIRMVKLDPCVGNAKLAAELGCSERSVIRYIKALLSRGDIEVSHGDDRQRFLTIRDPATCTDVDNVVHLHEPGLAVSQKGQSDASEASFLIDAEEIRFKLVVLDQYLSADKFTNKEEADCFRCGEKIEPRHGRSVATDKSKEPWVWEYRHLYPWECRA